MDPKRYTPSVLMVGLYLPRGGALAHVAEGSAIVGLPSEHGYIRCYYEGGVFQKATFYDYLTIAGDRLADRAPTSALAHVRHDQVTLVGEAQWDDVLRCWTVADILDQAALDQWAGTHIVTGGTKEQHQRAAGLLIDGGRDPEMMRAWQAAVAANADPVAAIIAAARLRSRQR